MLEKEHFIVEEIIRNQKLTGQMINQNETTMMMTTMLVNQELTMKERYIVDEKDGKT